MVTEITGLIKYLVYHLVHLQTATDGILQIPWQLVLIVACIFLQAAAPHCRVCYPNTRPHDPAKEFD